MGIGKKSHLVYAIDFGLAKRFIDPKTGKHNPHKFKNIVAGTVRYQSLNAHLKWEQSRKDDLEAIGYVLAYFLRGGNLPWSLPKQKPDDPQRLKKKERELLQLKLKQDTPFEELFGGHPDEFV
jgi:serine/threonine protein kinase